MSDFGQSRAKAERLLQLTAALGGTRPIALTELRENYGLYADGDLASSRRQFERDKSVLRDNGVEIDTVENGDGSLYWIRSRRKSFRLTDEELDALAVLAAVVGDPATGVSLATFAGESGQFAVDNSPGKVSVDNLAIPEAVTTALASGLKLAMTYRNAQGEEHARTIEPWELRHRAGLTYVIGFDDLHQAKRNFRLDRIVGQPTVGEAATQPRPDGPAGPVHPDERFTFDLAVPEWSVTAAEEFGGVVVSTEGESASMRFEDVRPWTILAWALRHGARVTAPAGWAEEHLRRAQLLVDRHQGDASVVVKPRGSQARTQPVSFDRMRRLMLLPRFLSKLQGVTRPELADYLGCSLEDLDAELELLDTVELPGHGPVGEVEEINGQIVYHRHLVDPLVTLGPSDALRLLFLVEMVRPILDDEAAGLEAVAQRLHEIIPATVKIDLAGARHPDIDLIKSAIREQQVISFDYQGRKDATRRERHVAPSQFRVAHGAIHLAGTDVAIGEGRQFRLDRMGAVTLTAAPAPATHPEPVVAASTTEIKATLLLGIRATWLLTQLGTTAVRENDDGSVVALVVADSKDWLVGHVLAAGGEAEVIEPARLRNEVAARAAALLA